MLLKILSIIEEEGRYRPAEIARQLGVSLELVEQAFELLIQKGYLKQVEGCSDGSCGGCSITDCRLPRARLWVRVK